MDSAFGFKETPTIAKGEIGEIPKTPRVEVRMPGGVYAPLGKDQIKGRYIDEVGSRLLVIIDEVAELTMPSMSKTEAGKAEDSLKEEIKMIISSIAQLGRSSCTNLVLATQRNEVSVIPGIIANNSLTLDTRLIVKREGKGDV